MIKIARNFLPLLRSRHDGDPLLEAWGLMLCVPRHDSEVARSVRSVEAPTLMPIAIDAAARCKGSKIVEGRTALAADFIGALFTVTRTQSRERRFETVSDLPAVAARAAGSQGTGIEDQCAAACGGGLARGGESRISGAHDQHIHRRGQSSLGQYRHGRGFLPQRRCDDAFAGHFRTSALQRGSGPAKCLQHPFGGLRRLLHRLRSSFDPRRAGSGLASSPRRDRSPADRLPR